jgi:small subunit ribosomal protein S9
MKEEVRLAEHLAQATGRRKTAVARVRLVPGRGVITVNGKTAPDYFMRETLVRELHLPLSETQTQDRYDVVALCHGGGLASQAGAMRLGIARALAQVDPDLRPALRRNGFLSRDSRMKERKKYGQPGARKRFQFSKR